jgi:hypothetical protein
MTKFFKTSSIDSSFFFLTMAYVVFETFQIFMKNEVLIVFLTVFTCMCAYNHGMVTIMMIIIMLIITGRLCLRMCWKKWHNLLPQTFFMFAGQSEPTWMDGALIWFCFLSMCHPKLTFYLFVPTSFFGSLFSPRPPPIFFLVWNFSHPPHLLPPIVPHLPTHLYI